MIPFLGALGGTILGLAWCAAFLMTGTWGRVALMSVVLIGILTWLVVAMREPQASSLRRWSLGFLLVVTLALSAVVLRALMT